ncbi:MAG: DinB family protein [Gemmatimonadaceae bacterium]|nr:DinB family protein [Gemmatimonadaceae bacterium]
MNAPVNLEWWQRGPIDGVPAVLQPVAHMMLQMRDEIAAAVRELPLDAWNAKPAGVASVAFHVRHIPGVLDRLFTYARGGVLNAEQISALRADGNAIESEEECAALVQRLSDQVDACLAELRGIDPSTLAEERLIGRAKLPSTMIGCIVHGAEHGMRHLGQLLVTVQVVRQP